MFHECNNPLTFLQYDPDWKWVLSELWLIKGKAYLQLEDWSEAIACGDKSLEYNDRNADATVLKTDALLKLGDYEKG